MCLRILPWTALCIALQAAPAAQAQLAVPAAGAPVPPDVTVFRIRVLDGRNGAPLENAHIRLWYDDAGAAGYVLATPLSGTVPMPEPIGLPVRILIGPVDPIDCRKLPSNEPAPGYNLQQIAEKGMVLQNTCGQVSAKAKPGELVLFARPLRWYENINRP